MFSLFKKLIPFLFIFSLQAETLEEVYNNVIFVGADSKISISIPLNVKFEKPIATNQATLILNCDNKPFATILNQTIRVSSLNGFANSGIITTKTGSQKWEDIDPLSDKGLEANPTQLMSKTLQGDNLLRIGTLEIFSLHPQPSFAEFSGEIKDNFSPSDNRGKVNIHLNAPNLTQTLSGKNSYTGYTKLEAGVLRMDLSSYKGNFILQGGILEVLSLNSMLYNLDWSSGGFKIDLKKHSPITISKSVNVSTFPQSDDAFQFSNISEGEFVLFLFESDFSKNFSNFANQNIDYFQGEDSYTGTFSVTSKSLKIIFRKK